MSWVRLKYNEVIKVLTSQNNKMFKRKKYYFKK